MFLGFLFTFLLPETKNRTLEEITQSIKCGKKKVQPESEPATQINEPAIDVVESNYKYSEVESTLNQSYY